MFYLRRGDRLIARMKHVLYGWRFARQAGGKAVVLWPPPGTWSQFDSMEYSPSLIFDLEEMARDATTSDLTFVETPERFPERRRSLRDPEFAKMRNNSFDREYFKQDGLVFHEDSLMQYRFSDEQRSGAALNAELSDLFGRLKLHPAVGAGLARVASDLGGEKYASLHVRAGDVFHMLTEELPLLPQGTLTGQALKRLLGHYVTRTAPPELYTPWVLKSIEAGQKLVFSTDSPDQIEWFNKRFGAEHFLNLADYQLDFPIQKALMDFIILSRGSVLYGPRSNFSSLACALGNIDLVTVSAANVTNLQPDEVIRLYAEQAIATFLPRDENNSAAIDYLAERISQHYRFVNRLGTKAEIEAMDPRRSGPADLAPILFPGKT
jgi:hypothetical protein